MPELPNISNVLFTDLNLTTSNLQHCVQHVSSTDVIALGFVNIIIMGIIVFLDIYPKYNIRDWKSRLISIAFMGNICAVFYQYIIQIL